MKRLIWVLPFLLLLSSCAIGPRYHRPAVLTPTNYRNYEGPAGNQSLADFPWWDVFHDKALQKLIEDALSHNYDIQIAAARVEEFRAVYGVTRGDLMPQIDLIAGASRQRNSLEINPLSQRTNSTYEGGFNLAWELDVWGKLRRATEAAKAQYFASDEARRGILVTLVGDVAEAYFALREFDLELEIARRTLETRKNTLELFTKRLEGGAASKLETSQAEADLADTAATIPDLERAIVTQENLLSVLLGNPPGEITRGDALSDQYKAPGVPIGLPSELLERRPDIRAAEQTLIAANAQVGASMADFLPSFNLSNFIGNSSHDWDHLWDGRAYNWSVAGSGRQPLFRGGKIFFGYKAAKARWEQALFDYQKTVINAFQEVSNAVINTRKLRDIKTEREKEVTSYREAANLSRMRYEGGLSSYLEVLDADRRLFDAETLLAKTKGRQMAALVQLYRALGGGWQMKKEVPQA